MHPCVFLVGCARSGTTLLHRLVDAHPQIAIVPEMHWITDFFGDRWWLDSEAGVTVAELNGMIEHERFRLFRFTPEQLLGLVDDGQPLPYVTFLNRFFALYRENSGKPLVGNKTPAYVRRIDALHSVWPEAKFVHLIRDGRDVCLSVRNWYHADRTAGRYSTWLEDPVSTSALWWKLKVLSGRMSGRKLPAELYYELQYENLVADPAAECDRLCSFLGLSYDDAMLRFHEGKTKTKPGLDAKRAWLPVTPGLRNWRTQMPAPEIERFEAAAGDLLRELGYQRAFPSPSPDACSRAARLQERFDRELQARVATTQSAIDRES
jgi:hypothetical protein